MCGICGLFSTDAPLSHEARAAVRPINDALAHRGPDGEGFYTDEFAALGQRRLAIIDREGGKQPMANEDESCWVVFNGEIYNHHDLRPELEAKGHRFRTVSDTEVILHAYEEYGPACVERFHGMFAFAIYDRNRREIFAARDRLGKKPFFYAMLGGVFHFSSDLASLSKSPYWVGNLDLTALEGYLSLGYFLAPASVYRDVYKLLPGHWLRLSARGLETRQYWDVEEFDTDTRTIDQLVPYLDETLRGAVLARLESEVPLGAFLSGGIDSGLVVSYMAEALDDRLVTVSVGFQDREYNELEAAGLVAKRFHSQHHAEVIEPRLEDLLDALPARLGEPLADASAIPTWYVSRAARASVTVALSGDGGDESFAGYDFRYVPHSMEAAARTWLPGIGPVAAWLGRRWPRSRRLPKYLRAGTLLENLGRDPAAAYYADLTFLKPGDTRALMGRAPLGDPSDPTTSAVYEQVTDPYRRCRSKDPVQRAEYADLKVYLPNDPLVKVDRMSMAHSLEVRCPLLDHRVVEAAFRIPARTKMNWHESKIPLRRLARNRLPPELSTLPKRGFSMPIGAWIAGPYRGQFEDEVLGSNSIVSNHLDRTNLRARLAAHCSGERDESYALWATWILERWLRYTSGRDGQAV